MPKRARGEGSWSYPKDGGVRLKVMYDGKAKYFYGKNQQVCLEKKKDFEALRKKGIDSDNGVTVEKYMTNWINVWIIPRLGDYKFNKLESIAIQTELINYMQDCGRSLSSIKKVKDALNGAYTYAV